MNSSDACERGNMTAQVRQRKLGFIYEFIQKFITSHNCLETSLLKIR